MLVVPRNLHMGAHILWPFTVMFLMVLIAFGLGLFISKPLPWFLRQAITFIFVSAAIILWFWLTFFVHIFPGI
jgi:hypothetical protein